MSIINKSAVCCPCGVHTADFYLSHAKEPISETKFRAKVLFDSFSFKKKNVCRPVLPDNDGIPLGAYGDALLRAAWDEAGAADALLQTLTPLFTRHLAEAGVGSISEIFDGDPPHRPDGCIAQAWSVGELLRVYEALERTAGRK